MVFEVIKNLFSLLPHLTQKAAVQEKKRLERKPKLMDMMEARTLSETARKKNVELVALINTHDTGEHELRERVARKVGALMAPHYQHAEILDEVTDKLCEVARYDERARKRWAS